MIAFFGYIGALMLAACALPLMLSTIQAGHARGVDPWFLGLWFFGEVAMLIHVLYVDATIQVTLNYIANVIMVGIIGAYKALRR